MPSRIEWDSGVVAGGVAIASPIFDLTGVGGLTVVADNSAGAAIRDVTLEIMRGDGTVVDTVTLRTVAIAAKERGVVGPQSGGALGTPALNFAYPITLPTKARVNLAAGGAANGRLTVFGG